MSPPHSVAATVPPARTMGRPIPGRRRRRRGVWALAAAVVLVVGGCGTSADPDTWGQAEEDARFIEAEFKDDEANVMLKFEAKSAVEHNFMQACLRGNLRTDAEDPAQALRLCRCVFDDLRTELTLPEFKALDKALREEPDPSDLDEEPEDYWDTAAEAIIRNCDREINA